MTQNFENDIAIIGLSGRFPKAKNVDRFWDNLSKGVNSTHFASDEELIDSGVPEELLSHPRFVNASLRLEDSDKFDADFFSIANSEALLMDPQIRMMLQTAWLAIEDAGYDVSQLDHTVGTFCGMSTSSYLMRMLESDAEAVRSNALQHRILNDKDFLATWIAYKLDLNGPAASVQTACSSSLLAVHMACQSLLNRECDMAMAGGVCVDAYQPLGYAHTPGSIFSQDGCCRPFDASASGMLNADGVGVIMLRRAEDAVANGDHIYALIKGTAANNDGAAKLSYTSPSVDYQRDVILEAMAVADVKPESIGMIEAHGTGTPLGDPVEIKALNEAFGGNEGCEKRCAIGSVKANIGHLDTAAGIAGLIKAVLCVERGMLLPSINYSEPNPELNLHQTPFYVSESLAPWPESASPRRAGISSFGVGGTNVHVVIEQAPKVEATQNNNNVQFVTLSAEHPESLAAQKAQLLEALERNPHINLADVEFTQLHGRKAMHHKFVAVCDDMDQLSKQLAGACHNGCFEAQSEEAQPIFLFPGQGSQYIKMSESLYREDGHFRHDMDDCFDEIKALSTEHDGATDFKSLLFKGSADELDQTKNTQLALFIVEYSLARYLERSGVIAEAYVGHSLGEYVAACLAGVMSLKDALFLIYHRARLMDSVTPGAMLSVKCAIEDLQPLLLDGVSISAYNSSRYFVLGGTQAKISQQQQALAQAGLEGRILAVSHAFHTEMMDEVLPQYRDVLDQLSLTPATKKLFSTCSGQLADPKLLQDSEYWLQQLREPVRFSMALEQVIDHYPRAVFIEVGPGRALSSLVKNHTATAENTAISLLGSAVIGDDEQREIVEAKAKIWLSGVSFKANVCHSGRRISLPGYAFHTRRFFSPRPIGSGGVNLYRPLKDLSCLASDSNVSTATNKVAEKLKMSVIIPLSPDQPLPTDAIDRLGEAHEKYLECVRTVVRDFGYDAVEGSREVLWREDNIIETENEEEQLNKNCRKSTSVYVAPQTPVQKMLAMHWQELLGYQPVGIHDDYFDVGGNSLIATHLMSRVTDELQIALSFKDLASCQTIEQLAKHIESKQWLASLSDDFAIDEGSEEVFEL